MATTWPVGSNEGASRIPSQVAILKSDTLLLTVAHDLDLANNPAFLGIKPGSKQTLPHQNVDDPRVRQTVLGIMQGDDRAFQVVNERWYSDDLQILVKSINTDPRFGVNMYELTDIKQTAPVESLFAPPSDYTLATRGH